MIRRPPRSTLSSSSAASDVYKRQPRSPSAAVHPDAGQASPWGPGGAGTGWAPDGGAPSGSSAETTTQTRPEPSPWGAPVDTLGRDPGGRPANRAGLRLACLLYTSDAADEEDSV